jgi:hypothetical protein
MATDVTVPALPYVYSELPYGRRMDRAFRVLTVLPKKTDPIECSLENATLQSASECYALSYTWGTELPTKAILLDGRSFIVRPNLWYFLKRLQTSGRRMHIWIDAICVDQENIPERNSQVLLMRHIYSKAKAVIVWLGEDVSGVLKSLRDRTEYTLARLRTRGAASPPPRARSLLPTTAAFDRTGPWTPAQRPSRAAASPPPRARSWPPTTAAFARASATV